MNPSMKIAATLCALIALCSSAASAKPLVVGVEDQAFAPHYFIDPQGQYQGYARELLETFARSEGIELIYKPMPVDRLLPALLDGSIDFKYPDNANWGVALKASRPLVYSEPLVEFVDGVLVAPKRLGVGLPALKKLAVADGWSLPGDTYQQGVAAGSLERVAVDDLPQMISEALRGKVDGVYFNVVVASYYLDNIRARPGALVFDPALPYTRSTYSLSTFKHPEVVQQMDRFLQQHREEVKALKEKYQVEANLDSEFLGMEQWKINFIKRQREREKAMPAPLEKQ